MFQPGETNHSSSAAGRREQSGQIRNTSEPGSNKIPSHPGSCLRRPLRPCKNYPLHLMTFLEAGGAGMIPSPSVCEECYLINGFSTARFFQKLFDEGDINDAVMPLIEKYSKYIVVVIFVAS